MNCVSERRSYVNARLEAKPTHWTLKGEQFALEVEVPVNTTATIVLPSNEKDTVTVGSGRYSFEATLSGTK